MLEARKTLEKFADGEAFDDWLRAHDLGELVRAEGALVSVRHGLYAAGRVHQVLCEQSAQPLIRPVDGMKELAALAVELRKATFKDDLVATDCSLMRHRDTPPCAHACYATVNLAASLGDACATLPVRALVCTGDMMDPYVAQQTAVLNALLARRKSTQRFLSIHDGRCGSVLVAAEAGLSAALGEGLLIAE
jgi:hypothetical protein